MPKYLFRASYTSEGAKGLISEGGSGRVEVAARLAESLGGRLEDYYFTFGEDDVVGILDLPDNVSMAAVAMTVGATGLVNTKTTVLLTPEEIDEAARKSVSYRGPGEETSSYCRAGRALVWAADPKGWRRELLSINTPR